MSSANFLTKTQPTNSMMANEEDVITTQGAASLAGAFQNPAVLGALQSRLGQLVGKSSGYIESLPVEVKRRVEALKNLQSQSNTIDKKFRMEVLELEKKYLKMQQPVYEKRSKIVTGAHEPTDAECEVAEDEKLPEGTPTAGEGFKGIPEFWLTCLKNMEEIAQNITEDDEKALATLIDIKVTYLENNPVLISNSGLQA
jgi:nucleosome assembly protein 1-like 1